MKAKSSTKTQLNVLVVCLGNICRSPAAQGILEVNIKSRHLNVLVDSAGTAAYHQGNCPDKRSIAELASRGVDISSQRARQVTLADFDAFDWVLAMDKSNLSDLLDLCPVSLAYKVKLFSNFYSVNTSNDVEDPYYGADDGFSRMADHLSLLSQHFLDHVESNP